MLRIARGGLRRLRIWKPDRELINRHIDDSTNVPVITDTGVHVSVVLSFLIDHGRDIERTQRRFPDLNPAQIRAVVAYAKTKAGKDLLKQNKRICRST